MQSVLISLIFLFQEAGRDDASALLGAGGGDLQGYGYGMQQMSGIHPDDVSVNICLKKVIKPSQVAETKRMKKKKK